MSTPKNQSFISNIINWIQDDWVMKLGGVLTLIGILWLAKYTIVNSIIGPIGQTSLGLLISLSFLLISNKISNKHLNLANALTIIGGLGIIGVSFAAKEVHNLLSTPAVFSLMFLATFYMSIYSVKKNNQIIAILAYLGAALIPNLVGLNPSYGEENLITINLVYLALINFGSLYISSQKSFKNLSLISIITTFIYSDYLSQLNEKTFLFFILTISTIYYLQFLGISFYNILKSQKMKIQDVLTALLNGQFALFITMEYIPENLQSIILCFLAVLGLSICKTARKHNSFNNIYYTFLAISVFFLGTATALAFDSFEVMTVAFALEAMLLIYLSQKRLKDHFLTSLSSLTFLVPLMMSLNNFFVNYSYNNQFLFKNSNLLVLITIIITSFINSKILRLNQNTKQIASVMLTVSAVYALRTYWALTISFISNYNIAKTIALLSFAIIGILSYLKANQIKNKGLELFAKLLFGFLALRLIFVEASTMSTNYKIISFILIGLILMTTSLINKKNK